MVTVRLSPAERCQNLLAKCKGSWFSDERFQIILKYQKEYYWAVRDGVYKEPEKEEQNDISS